MTGVIEFLTELREHNNREWFQANKGRYDVLRKQFIERVEQLITYWHSTMTNCEGCMCKIVSIASIAIYDSRPIRHPIKHTSRPIWQEVVAKVRVPDIICI